MAPLLDDAWRDLKHAFRRLYKNPGFTLTAVLSLALGAGANTAIFRVINAVRLRSLPISNPQELVEVKIAGGARGFGVSSASGASATFPLWREIEQHQQALSGVFAWGANDVRYGQGAGARLIRGLWLSPQAFRVLNVRAIRGRMFEAGDDRCDASVAVIGHQFWSTYFGAQDAAIGSRIVVDDRPLSVIGVAPREFFGLEVGKGFDVAVPLCERQAADPRLQRRDLWWLVIMGRLAPNVTLTAADAQISAMSHGVFEAAAPTGYDAKAMDTWNSFRLTLAPASGGISRLRNEYESSLWLLLAIAGMVLLIACLNLANLLLAQASARETEIAVRLALGVGRARLVAQLMTENLLLAILGTAAGTLLSSGLSSFLLTLLSNANDPFQLDLGADWRILIFTAALAVLICATLGIAPVLRLARTGIATAMKAGTRSGAQQPRRSVFQNVLIGSQLAISLFLLVGSFSFVRSFRSLATLNTGFRRDGLVFCFADFSHLRLARARISGFQTELLDTVRQTSGVELASTSTHVPLSGNSWTLGIKNAGSARFSWIGQDYFRTLGISMIAGRDFTERDSAGSKKVLIVNETFARQFRQRSAAVGSVIRSVAEPGYPETAYEIVAVVKDAKYDSLREKIPPVAYAPELQNPGLQAWTSIIFRASAPAPDAVAAVRSALAAKDPEIRMHFQVLRTMADESIARERLLAWLSGFFAALAALLTCIGLYGVIAYLVSLRRSEIAVRIALGATSSQIIGIIVFKTAMAAATGIAAGLVISLACARFVRSLLFALDPGDPFTLIGAVVALMAVSLLASMWAALRASSIEPTNALRNE